MTEVTPDWKQTTEGGIGRKKPTRGWRTRGRKTATPEEWSAIRSAKVFPGYCRTHGKTEQRIEAHHLISRARGGDDVAENIVGLCGVCHGAITRNEPVMLRLLAAMLTDAEYAYVIGKLGEGAMERLFGVGRGV